MKKAVLLFTISLFVFLSPIVFKTVFSSGEMKIASPLPDFLTSFKNSQVGTLDLWSPAKNLIFSDISPPELTAKSVLMYDLTENKIIYSKNPDQKVPMASLSKIMTAVIALENPKPDNRYIVSEADLVGENTMGLEAGEVLSLDELLYGLLLNSGNDAAEVLSRNYPGGRNAFIAAMNEKARALGVANTNFTNPSGLQGDGDQYSTAEELLVITRYALEKDKFREIVKTVEKHIAPTGTHKEYHLYNETNLLTSYPGVEGVKTGYTPEAGYCLITYLNYDGHQIIGVLLGSQDRRKEMKELLDYSLLSLGIEPPEHD